MYYNGGDDSSLTFIESMHRIRWDRIYRRYLSAAVNLLDFEVFTFTCPGLCLIPSSIVVEIQYSDRTCDTLLGIDKPGG